MGNSYMTLKEMEEVCNIKDLKYFRESYITPALDSRMLERLYPNHPKHQKQQYQLTEVAKGIPHQLLQFYCISYCSFTASVIADLLH